MVTLLRKIASLVLLAALLGCNSEQSAHQVMNDAPGHLVVPNVSPSTLSEMRQFFSEMDYNWHSLRQGVPPFILENFPADLDDDIQIQKKKKSFFLGLLPMVLLANQEIRSERQFLVTLFSRHEHPNELSEEDRSLMKKLVRKYRLRGDPLRDHRLRTRLLKRVDTIPPSLVLAQAANESAWGTSRFARLGNNLFGQWTFTPGTGIVPENRPEGATYEVKKFSSLYDSVHGYMLNLNTHSAYFELREIRSSLRDKGSPVTGRAIARGLTRYSSRGEAYVAEIRDMIRQNQLSLLNDATLRLPSTEFLNTPKMTGNGMLSTRRQIASGLSESWKNPKI